MSGKMRVKKVVVDKANRLFQYPPDLNSFFRGERRPSLIKKNRLIDLATFHWPVEFDEEFQPSPSDLKAATESELSDLAEELSEWMAATHGIKLIAKHELLLGGSVSTQMLHLALGLFDPGELVLVPDLSLPLYRSAIAAAGGQAVTYQLDNRHGYKPDFERINSRVGRVARFLILNNPHNPTGADLSTSDMEVLIYYASRENIAIISDAAYSSIPQRTPASMLSLIGGKKVGAELHSFAYLLGLPNIGLGFAAGNREIISALRSSSRMGRYYFPRYYVELVRRALRRYPSAALKEARRQMHQSSREAEQLLELLSMEKRSNDNTPFIWVRILKRGRASNAASILYRSSRIMTTPGTAFGEAGEGYLRLSLTAPPEDFREAAARIKTRRPFAKSGDDE